MLTAIRSAVAAALTAALLVLAPAAAAASTTYSVFYCFAGQGVDLVVQTTTPGVYSMSAEYWNPVSGYRLPSVQLYPASCKMQPGTPCNITARAYAKRGFKVMHIKITGPGPTWYMLMYCT